MLSEQTPETGELCLGQSAREFQDPFLLFPTLLQTTCSPLQPFWHWEQLLAGAVGPILALGKGSLPPIHGGAGGGGHRGNGQCPRHRNDPPAAPPGPGKLGSLWKPSLKDMG